MALRELRTQSTEFQSTPNRLLLKVKTSSTQDLKVVKTEKLSQDEYGIARNFNLTEDFQVLTHVGTQRGKNLETSQLFPLGS